MNRLDLNDLLMEAYFGACRAQGFKTEKLEEVYGKQRLVCEAELLVNQKGE